MADSKRSGALEEVLYWLPGVTDEELKAVWEALVEKEPDLAEEVELLREAADGDVLEMLDERNKLRSELAEREKNSVETGKAAVKLGRQKEAAEAECERLSNERAGLLRTLSRVNLDNNELRNKVDKQRSELYELRAELSKERPVLATMIEEFNAERERLGLPAKSFREPAEALEAENERLQAEVKALNLQLWEANVAREEEEAWHEEALEREELVAEKLHELRAENAELRGVSYG